MTKEIEKQEKLDVLYRSKIIKEMTLEDLEIWSGFDKVYPSCLRFPESVEWNWKNTIKDRKGCIKKLKGSLKIIDNYIRELSGLKRTKSDKRLFLFMEKQKKILDIHLRKLKEIRDKRLNERLNLLSKNKLKKMKQWGINHNQK